MEIEKLLGGYNCGGCGYDDCKQCAIAISKGEDPSVCMLIDEDNIAKIKKIVKENSKN